MLGGVEIMTDRLLTEEEIGNEYGLWADFDKDDLCQVHAVREVVQSQDTKTLKAVGEWLEKWVLDSTARLLPEIKDIKQLRELSLHNDMVLAQLELKGGVIHVKKLINQLKQGKMSE